jgi:hypothetical protein
MTKRAKEMIEKRLRLALLVSAQGLRESNEIGKSGFQLVTHSTMLTKSAATDKRLCSARQLYSYWQSRKSAVVSKRDRRAVGGLFKNFAENKK